MPNFNDPFVVRGSKLLIAAIAAGLVAIAMLGVSLTFDWYLIQDEGQLGEGSALLSDIVRLLPTLSGKAVSELLNTIAIFGISLPFLLGKVCFERDGKTLRLSRFGRTVAVVLACAFALSLVPYFLIQPDVWGDGHRMEIDGVAKMQEWTKAVLRYSVMYGAALAGVRVSQ